MDRTSDPRQQLTTTCNKLQFLFITPIIYLLHVHDEDDQVQKAFSKYLPRSPLSRTLILLLLLPLVYINPSLTHLPSHISHPKSYTLPHIFTITYQKNKLSSEISIIYNKRIYSYMMDAIMGSSFSGSDILMKVVIFVLVQALVYLILSKSSNIFSSSDLKRSHSFRPARSVSIRRLRALLTDVPAGGELSPSVPKGSTSTVTTPNSAAARHKNHAS